MIQAFGIGCTLLLLIALAIAVYKGVPILVASPICGALCLLCNGMPVMEGMKEAYIGEAAGFFKTWFLFFLAGAILGKIMERSGAAASIARFIIDKCGTGMAIPAVVIACGVLMMGGVSGFVVVFTLAPLSVELFRTADIPRQYILPTIAMGNAGPFMWIAGSPQVQNVLPMNLFGTTATAGFVVSIICTVFFIALSLIYLNTKLKKDRARGLHFESRPKDVILADEVELPSFFMSILPLIVVFGMFALLQVDILLALVIGIVVALIISRKYLKGNVMKTLMAGADGATTNMVGVAMIVAFAGAFKSTPNFQLVVDALLDLPFPPLVSAAIAVNVLCGITASAGGGLQVALPVIAQPYLDLGVNAVALHRVTAISCGVLDSMPHSAWLNATLEATQLTQKETYKMFATICIGIAALTTVLAIVLFSVFPVLCNF
ncbi:MAG: GntP family permease [Clostridia bacterium]|nr:GntP family permease [Clostridia bacterium]